MRHDVLTKVEGGRGLEIGGPSAVFAARGILPVYPRAARLDNVNFSTKTAWEHGIADGGEFRFDSQHDPGSQWVREAVALNGIGDADYDFVLSSHCLEHVANPLQALREWWRVIRPGGHLVLVLPNAAKTFDHRRPVTTLAHLRRDFECGIGEDDQTHFVEAIALHDASRDAGVESAEEFRARLRDNAQNRCLHHHVFDLELVRTVLVETNWRVLATEAVRPLHLVALAQREG